MIIRERLLTRVGLFTAAMTIVGIAQPAELTEQIYSRTSEYSRLDSNGDGFVSAEEYNGTGQLFEATDTDADGKLSPDEATYMITFAEIPAGSFIMGTTGTESTIVPVRDAAPEHEVFIDGFQMATTEVTTAQYASYLNSALEAGQISVEQANSGPARIAYPLPIWTVYGAPGTKYEGKSFHALSPVAGLSHLRADGHPLLIPEHPLNQSWISYIPELEKFTVASGFEDWPAAFIRWYGAMAFAEYYDLSLPTEAEWEYASRGGGQFRFATSDGTISCGVANFKCYNGMRRDVYAGVDTPDEYVGHRVNVGSYPANPYGVFDLAGNVWEWCLDWYDEDFYQQSVDDGIVRNPLNLDGVEPPAGTVVAGVGSGNAADTRVTRGGSYQYHETTTESASRRGMYPFRGNDHWGFRVVHRSSPTVFNGKD
jgi:sulfatase modifying factor 1